MIFSTPSSSVTTVVRWSFIFFLLCSIYACKSSQNIRDDRQVRGKIDWFLVGIDSEIVALQEVEQTDDEQQTLAARAAALQQEAHEGVELTEAQRFALLDSTMRPVADMGRPTLFECTLAVGLQQPGRHGGMFHECLHC